MATFYQIKTKFEASFKRNPQWNEMKPEFNVALKEWDEDKLEVRLKHSSTMYGFETTKSGLVSGHLELKLDGDELLCSAEIEFLNEISPKAFKELQADKDSFYFDVLSSEKLGFLAVDGEWGKELPISVEIVPAKKKSK